MKYVALAAVMAISLSSCKKEGLGLDPIAQIKASRNVDIHILSGQSNATGQGLISQLHVRYQNPLNKCWVWNDISGTIDTLHAGVNNEGGGCGGVSYLAAHGMELSFMQRMSMDGGTHMLVKRAYNSSVLYNLNTASPNVWERPDAIPPCNPQRTWNINHPQSAYWELRNECLAAKNAVLTTLPGRVPKFRTLIWYQGESDARYAQRVAAWEQNLRDMFNQLKIDLNEPDLKLIVMRARPGWGGFPAMPQLRTAQNNIGLEAWAETINADAYALSNDVHVQSQGLVALGNTAADVRQAMP